MATERSNSILGSYRGKIGNVVLSDWNGTGTMRKTPEKQNKKKITQLQARQNKIFGMMNRFLKGAKTAINLGYQLPRKAKMTAYNAAVSYHLNQVTGKPDNPAPDFAKIKLSRPVNKTQQAWNPVLSAESEYKVTVKWELNPFPDMCTRLDDKVILVYYDTKINRFINFVNVAGRRDLSYTVNFIDWDEGHELHWYMFMASRDGKLVSETEYLGMITVKA
ncbi:DUF6266 family protein [Pedobacter hartonius]|uniref:Uncharacterized protein n=1 Tax=Pedobacter hartonius TaxID=425514 RepID=A0A1H4GB76_9SPHI|nr:DUF6266 family protein [Pedobacter hartonius]SEB06859.1 hypothetical protein SAMN05443550_109191 [Pedobacter hartonius]